MSSPNDPRTQEQCSGGAKRSEAAAAYRPSVVLLCALIFWTGISAIAEVIIPFDAIFFAVATYAPTLHFAAQAIVRRSAALAGVQPPDVRQASFRARLLAVSWVLNVVIHVGLWWADRRNDFAGIFLLPTFPGSQATLVIICIAIRYTVDIYMTRREQRLVVPRDDEEAASTEIVAPLQPVEAGSNSDNISPQREDSAPATETIPIATASPPAVPLYQPSIPLLLISISLSLCALVLDFRAYTNATNSTILAIITSLQAYIPTVLLHSYLVFRILRRNRTETLKHTTAIAGLSFDLIPLWLGTRALIAVYLRPEDSVHPVVHMVPGAVEILLAVYFAVRYTRSVYAERRHRIEMGTMESEDDLEPPIDDNEAPSSATQPTDSAPFYHPSPILLVISVILSTACLIIESLAESICGVPMSAIVYVPTIAIHLHLIYQQHLQSPNPDSDAATTSIQKYNKAMERSMQLCLIWVLTQAFYVFVWPVSQYLNPDVMNPWIRWPEVGVIVYIAARYVRDRRVRNSVGSIRLPPDDSEEGDFPTAGRSAVDSNQ